MKFDHQVSSRSRDDETRVNFGEDKLPDWSRVQELLDLSARAGRWANFGPVQQHFSESVARILDLGLSREVVSASSATSALFAIGPLAHHGRVVDCDANGMIDISAISALPADSWDGLVTTDLSVHSSTFPNSRRSAQRPGNQ